MALHLIPEGEKHVTLPSCSCGPACVPVNLGDRIRDVWRHHEHDTGPAAAGPLPASLTRDQWAPPARPEGDAS